MKVLGKTDERTNCEKCGKRHLKVTVALETETGEIVFYGTTCAARALRKSTGMKVSKSDLDTAARAIGLARKWFDKGYSNKEVAEGIWNRIGYGQVAATETGIKFKESCGWIEVNR